LGYASALDQAHGRGLVGGKTGNAHWNYLRFLFSARAGQFADQA